jgi:hypothetical protein
MSQLRHLDDPQGPGTLGLADRERIRAAGTRRRRTRMGLVAAPIAVAVAVGVPVLLSSNDPRPARLVEQPSTTGTPTATPEPTSSPAVAVQSTGTPRCQTSGLRVSFGQTQGAAGTIYTAILFKNLSRTSCTLTGFPGLSFLDAHGKQVGPAAARDPRPVRTLTIAPGKTIFSSMGIAEAANYPTSMCKPATATKARIYPPGNTASVVLAVPGGSVSICTTSSQGGGGQQVHVTPVSTSQY